MIWLPQGVHLGQRSNSLVSIPEALEKLWAMLSKFSTLTPRMTVSASWIVFPSESCMWFWCTEQVGAEIVECACIIELTDLKVRKRFLFHKYGACELISKGRNVCVVWGFCEIIATQALQKKLSSHWKSLVFCGVAGSGQIGWQATLRSCWLWWRYNPLQHVVHILNNSGFLVFARDLTMIWFLLSSFYTDF
jgi:hypothetical protein